MKYISSCADKLAGVCTAQQVSTWIAGVAYTHKTQNVLELIAELYDQAAGRDSHNTLGVQNTLITYLGLQVRY